MGKKKILVVDDQYGIRLLLSEVFNAEGYHAFQAANGNDAIDIVKNEEPDLVILDMKIPGMDGLQILKSIRENSDDMMVIMMTAYGELDLLDEAYKYGILKHFTKPFDINDLKICIKEIFQNKIKNRNIQHEKVIDI